MNSEYYEAAGIHIVNEGDGFPYRVRQSSTLRFCQPYRLLATDSGGCTDTVATAGASQPDLLLEEKRRSLSVSTSSLGELHPALNM